MNLSLSTETETQYIPHHVEITQNHRTNLNNNSLSIETETQYIPRHIEIAQNHRTKLSSNTIVRGPNKYFISFYTQNMHLPKEESSAPTETQS